jgi:hypothetical protein
MEVVDVVEVRVAVLVHIPGRGNRHAVDCLIARTTRQT